MNEPAGAPEPDATLATSPPVRRRWLAWMAYGAAALAVLAIAMALTLRWLVARAPRYQEQIKALVHDNTGLYVRFARIAPTLHWFGPELFFQSVELRSKDDRYVLATASGASIGLDLWGVIRSFGSMAVRVRIDGARVEIERRGPRSFLLGSQLELYPQDSNPKHLNLSRLPIGFLRLRDAHVTLRNWNPELPELALDSLNGRISHRGDSLAADLKTRMPQALQGDIRMSAQLAGLADTSAAGWGIQAQARDFSLAGWHRLLPDYSNDFSSGVARFDALASGHGTTLTLADADLAAYRIAVRLPARQATSFDELSAGLSLRHSGEFWSLIAHRMRARRQGHDDPPMELSANWQQAASGLRDLAARANVVDAEQLLPLVSLLPDKALRDRINALGLSGRWIDPFVESWTAPVAPVAQGAQGAQVAHAAQAAPTRSWRINARFERIGLAAADAKPGFSGLSGAIIGNDRGGHLSIDSTGARLIWPEQFLQPLAFETFHGEVNWTRKSDGLLVTGSNVSVKNPDVDAIGQFAYQLFDDERPAQIMLASKINRANAPAAPKYLPRQKIGPKALEWLDRAFVTGRVPRGDFVLRGPLKNYPFRDDSGLFLIRFPVEDLTLDYHPGWPLGEHLGVDAEFRNAGLRVRIRHGQIGGLALDGGSCVFDDFKEAELRAELLAHGDAVGALGVLRASPVDAMAEGTFSAVNASGPLQARVNLDLPFKQFDQRRVLVDVSLHGVGISHPASNLSAQEVAGDFTVEGGQVTRAELHGRMLGGAFELHAQEPRAATVRGTMLDARGDAAVESVVTTFGAPASIVGGAHFDWRASIRILPEPNRERSVRIASNLQGVEIKLPAPLGKPAERSTFAYLDLDWPKGAGMQMRFGLPPTMRGVASLGAAATPAGADAKALDAAKSADAKAARPTRVTIAFGGATPALSSDAGTTLTGTLPSLDLDAWLRLPDKSAGAGEGKSAAPELRVRNLSVGELEFHSLAFRDLTVDVSPTENAWVADVSGDRNAGRIVVPKTGVAPFTIDMRRLSLTSPSESFSKDTSDKPLSDPRALPSVNLNVREFYWNDRLMGALQGALERRGDGVDLTLATLTNPSTRFEAKGSWRGLGEGQTRLEGTLASTSVEDTLQQFGIADVIHARSGHLDFDLNQLGPPSADTLASLNGRVKVDLQDGELTGIKPGAGRLLGLASVASLRRRLSLDFSDLTDKGLAFDSVQGSYDLRAGDASTEDLLLKGPAAEVGLIGRVGLAKRDYDQTAVVTGHGVGTTLPLASTLVGGPVVGAAVLLFTQVFKQPLKGLARGYYRITGSWDNPTVERVKGDAASAVERHESPPAAERK